MSDHKRKAWFVVFLASSLGWLAYVALFALDAGAKATSFKENRKPLNRLLQFFTISALIVIGIVATVISKIPAAYKHYVGKRATPAIDAAASSVDTPAIEDASSMGLRGRAVYNALTLGSTAHGFTESIEALKLSTISLAALYFVSLNALNKSTDDSNDDDPDSTYIARAIFTLLMALPLAPIPTVGYAGMYAGYDLPIMRKNALAIAKSVDNNQYSFNKAAFLFMLLTSSVNLAALPLIAYVNFNSLFAPFHRRHSAINVLGHVGASFTSLFTLLSVISMMPSVYRSHVESQQASDTTASNSSTSRTTRILRGGAYVAGEVSSAMTGLVVGMAVLSILEQISDSRWMAVPATIAGLHADRLAMEFSFMPGAKIGMQMLEERLQARPTAPALDEETALRSAAAAANPTGTPSNYGLYSSAADLPRPALLDDQRDNLAYGL